MGKVVFTENAESKLEKLVTVLYKKGYFGFHDSAMQYVGNLREFAKSVAFQKKHSAKNRRHGAWYIRYKQNRHTTWYFSFDTDGELYVIRNITNNHTKDYPTYIRGLK